MKKRLKELLTSQWSDTDFTKSKPSKNTKMMKGIGQELIDAGSSYSIARSISGKSAKEDKTNDTTVIVVENAPTKVGKKSIRRNPMVTKVPPKEIRSVRVGDSIADILAKMYNLMWKKSEDELKAAEVRKNFEEERESEDNRRHEQLLKAIRESRIQSREELSKPKPTAVPEKDKEKLDESSILSKLSSLLSGIGSIIEKMTSFVGFIGSALLGALGQIGSFLSGLVGGLIGGAFGVIFSTLKGILTTLKLLRFVPSIITALISGIRAIASIPIIGKALGPIAAVITGLAASDYALSRPKQLLEDMQVAAMTGNLDELIKLADEQAMASTSEGVGYDPTDKYRIARDYLSQLSNETPEAKEALEKFDAERAREKRELEDTKKREENFKKLKADTESKRRERLNFLLKNYRSGATGPSAEADGAVFDRIDYLLKNGVSPEELATLFPTRTLERYYQKKKLSVPKFDRIDSTIDVGAIDMLIKQGMTPEQIAERYPKEKLKEYYEAKLKAGEKVDNLKAIGDLLVKLGEMPATYFKSKVPQKISVVTPEVRGRVNERLEDVHAQKVFEDLMNLDFKKLPEKMSEAAKNWYYEGKMPEINLLNNSTTGTTAAVDPTTPSVRNDLATIGRAAKRLANPF